MKKVCSSVLLMALLSGCGAEIAYKQGATPRDLQAGKVACKAEGSKIALNQCLEDNGWVIQKLGDKWLSDDDLFAKAEVADGNGTRQTKETVKGFTTTESLKVETAETPTEESHTPKPAEATKPEIKMATTNTGSKPTASDKTKLTPMATKQKPNVLDTYVIKSWWKMGGSPRQLEQQMSECRDALGKAHQPNKKTFTFTRGFAICMREKGWRGLIER